jgi:hypothetical protein
MPMRLLLLALLPVALLPLRAVAADKVTLLFTGDNGGEVAPCG